MIRYLRFGLGLYLSIVLQTVFVPSVALFGVAPDLPFLLTVLVALHEGAAAGAVFGFLSGLFVDLASAELLGLTSLANSVVAFAVGSLSERLVREARLTQVVVTLLATALRDQIVLLLLQPSGLGAVLRLLILSSLPRGLYTGLLAPLAMPLVGRFARWGKEAARAKR
jgi:rod shape-determining protein MreD